MSFTSLRPFVLAAALSLIATACVTINIYFPAAAAEKAADRIIDEVWQIRGAQTQPAAPTDEGAKQ
ncbi:conserved exported protein of unknown function [Thauera humireducens]|jgi:hypothetical protein|uniref:hypothetical protein n=1 Tax=Thauera TaxID=33057 RepID=UPI0002D0491E|nr:MULTISPECIES: hypothetical protein [Thauera]ENO77709.1 hypothetical protein C664_11032 [Thauera sp. 63]CAH1745312.1 conserved exported protein of unknown function [Thauera humireducens]